MNTSETKLCDVPPPGWVCSREKGHDGPCAASQADKGSGSLEFDGLLAKFHAAVWDAAANEESQTDYDLAGVDIAKEIQAMFRVQSGELLGSAYQELQTENDRLRNLLGDPCQRFTYTSSQSTNCAGCGKHKHTPLRVDAMGGYVCLTCIDNELERLLIEESAREAEGDWPGCQEIADLPRVHEVMTAFTCDPTEDNGIAVVQAIVQATTRKPIE